MHRLLNRVSISVAAEKDLTKELRQMSERLQAIDKHPDEELSPEQTDVILGNDKSFLWSISFILIVVTINNRSQQLF